jgi:hypothetical protein
MDFWGFSFYHGSNPHLPPPPPVGAIAHPNSPHKRLKNTPFSKLCRCKWVGMMSVQS